VQEPIRTHTFDSGLVLLAEPMPNVRSAAFCFAIPAGAAYSPRERQGLGYLTFEMMHRGAGDRDRRQFLLDLDNLGVQRRNRLGDAGAFLAGATIDESLPQALEIYVDMILRPMLLADQIEASRQNALQEIRAVEDDPSHKASEELGRLAFPFPWGEPTHGDIQGVSAIEIEDVRRFHGNMFRAEGSVLAVAGRFDWEELVGHVERLLGEWPAGQETGLTETQPERHYSHLDHDSHQTQIAIAYPTVPYMGEGYFEAWGASMVLGGGPSSRLFTEVRERRGLCYGVGTSYQTVWNYGGSACYAGTMAERAQETLDVMIDEIRRMPEGIDADELQRVKAGAKSSLVMQQESSISRARSLAGDWFMRGEISTIDWLIDQVDNLTAERITAHLRENPPRDFVFVTVGNEPLEVPNGVL